MSKIAEIYLAGGCFWGAQHFLKRIHGVVDTKTGYANGNDDGHHPSYKEVYTDTTGYAETVKVVYDPEELSLAFLIEMYFKAIDPLSLNQQGEDRGTRYRTGIYFTDPKDEAVIRYIFDGEQKKYDQPMQVEVEPLASFYEADEYHQDYLDKNPDGYCHLPEALFQLSRGARCPMRKTRDFLEQAHIPYEIHFHPPLFTIAEALEWWQQIDALHCKNIFMRNHKGNRHYLVSFECHKDLDIHSLEHSLHQGKLSFASPERMSRCLGLRPGSVSPFGLINDINLSDADPKELFDNGHRVKLYLDKDILEAPKVSFHPCDNTASIVIDHDGLMKFIELWGGELESLDVA